MHILRWREAAAVLALSLVPMARANAASLKLPYANGEAFVVTQGYHAPPTHINKDAYALDFAEDRCDAYGKNAVAAAMGSVIFASGDGYNGGYGAEVMIDHGGGLVSRYAHLVAGSVLVRNGDAVLRGEPLGKIGNTGLVAGNACAEHPGAHLHFAFYRRSANGAFIAEDPEPISAYRNIEEGEWLLSDNIIDWTAAVQQGAVLGARTSTAESGSGFAREAAVAAPATSGPRAVSSSATVPLSLPGAVGVSTGPPPASGAVQNSTGTATSTDDAPCTP